MQLKILFLVSRGLESLIKKIQFKNYYKYMHIGNRKLSYERKIYFNTVVSINTLILNWSFVCCICAWVE